MRAAHVTEDFYLNRITLPALTYGASLSGSTVGQVTTPTAPSHLVKEIVTQPLRQDSAANVRAKSLPLSAEFSSGRFTSVRTRTAIHF